MELLYKTQKAGRWFTVREVAQQWLAERRHLPADAVCEFKTSDNTLSVFELDRARNNAARIVAAIASKSNNKIVNTDCLVFDSAILADIGITRNKKQGETPDNVANEWHWDLTELTGVQLVKLAEELVNRAVLLSLLDKELISALQGAASAGELQKDQVSRPVMTQANL